MTIQFILAVVALILAAISYVWPAFLQPSVIFLAIAVLLWTTKQP
jgi:hypothetical protein